MISKISKEDRLIKCMDGHTEDYTDGFYDGVASGHQMCIHATKTKLIPTIRERAINEYRDELLSVAKEYIIDEEIVSETAERIKDAYTKKAMAERVRDDG